MSLAFYNLGVLVSPKDKRWFFSKHLRVSSWCGIEDPTLVGNISDSLSLLEESYLMYLLYMCLADPRLHLGSLSVRSRKNTDRRLSLT
ncbi:hypothetical protein KC887_09265, partial [Candidatus Kaiserbacteria bacterium]|nr:hypothetical protein [Candidatus Kaiserbacteria bacterium]